MLLLPEEEEEAEESTRVPTSEVLKQAGTDFCENTSLHGFSYWVSDGKRFQILLPLQIISNSILSIANIPEKIFWVAIVVIGGILGSELLYQAVDEWANNPTGKIMLDFYCMLSSE